MGRASHERLRSEHPPRQHRGQVSGPGVAAIGPHGRGDVDPVVHDHECRLSGGKPPGDRDRVFHPLDKRGRVQRLVANLQHPHARLDERRHEPIEGGQIGLRIDQHAKSDASKPLPCPRRSQGPTLKRVKPVAELLEARRSIGRDHGHTFRQAAERL